MMENQLKKSLDKILDSDFIIEEKQLSINLEEDTDIKEENIPISVPKKLCITKEEFMKTPLEHFKTLCEDNYMSVISSLSYMETVKNQNRDVLEHIEQIKRDLKKWKKEQK